MNIEEASAAAAWCWTLRLITAFEYVDRNSHWSDSGFRPSLREWEAFTWRLRDYLQAEATTQHPSHEGPLARLEWDYEVDAVTAAAFESVTGKPFPLHTLPAKTHVALLRRGGRLVVQTRAYRGAPFEEL